VTVGWHRLSLSGIIAAIMVGPEFIRTWAVILRRNQMDVDQFGATMRVSLQ
jgi:hypothetical protein